MIILALGPNFEVQNFQKYTTWPPNWKNQKTYLTMPKFLQMLVEAWCRYESSVWKVLWKLEKEKNKVTTPNCNLFTKLNPTNSHLKCIASIHENLRSFFHIPIFSTLKIHNYFIHTESQKYILRESRILLGLPTKLDGTLAWCSHFNTWSKRKEFAL